MKADWQTKVIAYLGEILGLEATFHGRDDRERFPALLEQAYAIGALEIQGQPYLALHAESEVPSMDTVAKHRGWFAEKTKRRVIFVFDRINAYDRKKLIERRLPFLVPGNQLYLPDLGIDLREHFRAPTRTQRALTPAAQVVVLAAVLGRMWINDEMTGTGLAEQLGYTKMTMTRALDELRQHGWVETEGARRFARTHFKLTRRELWEQARPYLRTPVVRRIYLDEWGTGSEYLAGESALAQMSMLAPRKQTTWAMTNKQWGKFEANHPHIEVPEESKQEAKLEVEIWRYDPALLVDPPQVDPLSLALSLEKVQDERVQLAVDQLIEGIRW